MFTGLIEKTTPVLASMPHSMGLKLRLESFFEGVSVGESIAINGVCLTVLDTAQPTLNFDISPETLALTTLGELKPGMLVNVERAMLASSRFGGHYVSGHVDTVLTVEAIAPVGDYIKLTVTGFKPEERAFVVVKGSITLDGVSLTINEVTDNSFSVMLIPHTLAHTTLNQLTVNSRVNTEFDYFTRIVAHQLAILGHNVR